MSPPGLLLTPNGGHRAFGKIGVQPQSVRTQAADNGQLHPIRVVEDDKIVRIQ